jgi:hypothetical protein
MEAFVLPSYPDFPISVEVLDTTLTPVRRFLPTLCRWKKADSQTLAPYNCSNDLPFYLLQQQQTSAERHLIVAPLPRILFDT